MSYQFNPDMLPDAEFHPGHLKYVVMGNEGRSLDPRRTPFRVVNVNEVSGFFEVELLDFEDKGARWEVPLEGVRQCQFAKGSVEAGADRMQLYKEVVTRLDHPLVIPIDPSRRSAAEASIANLRADARAWLRTESAFLGSGETLNLASPAANPALCDDLRRYMSAHALWDIEEGFAEQYVRNPHSGELVKGHSIALAELGLAAFEGTLVRKPDLFSGMWTKDRRADHILHRLAFVREIFEYLGDSTIVLYRGFSYRGQPEVRAGGFVSATFSADVARSHFESRDAGTTGVLLRQSVPVERLFMSFLETAQMNRHYQEAEAVLLHESGNGVF